MDAEKGFTADGYIADQDALESWRYRSIPALSLIHI